MIFNILFAEASTEGLGEDLQEEASLWILSVLKRIIFDIFLRTPVRAYKEITRAGSRELKPSVLREYEKPLQDHFQGLVDVQYGIVSEARDADTVKMTTYNDDGTYGQQNLRLAGGFEPGEEFLRPGHIPHRYQPQTDPGWKEALKRLRGMIAISDNETLVFQDPDQRKDATGQRNLGYLGMVDPETGEIVIVNHELMREGYSRETYIGMFGYDPRIMGTARLQNMMPRSRIPGSEVKGRALPTAPQVESLSPSRTVPGETRPAKPGIWLSSRERLLQVLRGDRGSDFARNNIAVHELHAIGRKWGLPYYEPSELAGKAQSTGVYEVPRDRQAIKTRFSKSFAYTLFSRLPAPKMNSALTRFAQLENIWNG
ncbi:MAG TPA: hypothetical protein VJC03_00740, partial [bacterium]|nr:hypothetical protein [bacterium]